MLPISALHMHLSSSHATKWISTQTIQSPGLLRAGCRDSYKLVTSGTSNAPGISASDGCYTKFYLASSGLQALAVEANLERYKLDGKERRKNNCGNVCLPAREDLGSSRPVAEPACKMDRNCDDPKLNCHSSKCSERGVL